MVDLSAISAETYLFGSLAVAAQGIIGIVVKKWFNDLGDHLAKQDASIAKIGEVQMAEKERRITSETLFTSMTIQVEQLRTKLEAMQQIIHRLELELTSFRGHKRSSDDE